MNPARTVLRTEFRLFLREPGALFWIMAFPVTLMVILGLIPSFREPQADLAGLRVIDLYVPISVLLSAVMATVQAMPTVLTAYRDQKILRRYATTPVRPWHLLGAQFALHGGAVVVGALTVLLVGRVAFDVPLPGSLGAYLLVFALALAAALTIGGLIAGLSGTTRAATAIGGAVFVAMMFTTGVWIPVQSMPDLLRHLVELTPFGAAVRGLDQAMTGQWPDLRFLGVLLAWAVGLGALATRYFRWE